MHTCVTWISRVFGIHRKLTVADSFFINSEAMSPSPAPCSQSRTRSRFVRIWTALDQENSPSGKEQNGDLFHSSQNNMDNNNVISSKTGDYYNIYQQKCSSLTINGFKNPSQLHDRSMPTLLLCVTFYLSPATC